MFYNTVNLTGHKLHRAKAGEKTQRDIILDVFREHRALTPSQALRLSGRHWPPTSVRRAICDLTAAGELDKTEKMEAGPFGKPEHVWQYVEKLNYQQPHRKRWDEKSHYNRFHREG